ncbi:hypothetical protein AYO20_09409 [Fonsecaea nubica]|uniref:Uncharacterized protein n=1 Tax=Fonsecaea nubica TaxID=856822 RepID=A0A178CHY9_9EURO|nr:hypothetical protein AYO20_09409 [Fonsecaea nubica]OAL28685.1 hypothetical protein AYO20_09409 [Fonsecaea nubica]
MSTLSPIEVKRRPIKPTTCLLCFQTPRSASVTFHKHCIAAVTEALSSASRDDPDYNQEPILESALASRPIIHPQRHTVQLLAKNLFEEPVSTFIHTRCDLKRLKSLPFNVLSIICTYLDPFPELMSIIQTLPLLARYMECDKPSWSTLTDLKPGMTLFMTFDKARGIEYLTNLSKTNENLNQSRVLVLGDEIVVCRDHFGIQSLSCGEGPPKRDESRNSFYSTIPLRKVGVSSSHLRLFKDGVIVRFLAPTAVDNIRAVEWNVPSLPTSTIRFSKNVRTSQLDPLARFEYHSLVNIRGISAVVRNSRTIDLFCHQKTPGVDFALFARRFEDVFPGHRLLFLYFPVAKEENVQIVCLRRLTLFKSPLDMPVLQVATDRGRSYTFGPRPKNQNLFVFEAVSAESRGRIEGFFHQSVGEHAASFTEAGVAISGECKQDSTPVCIPHGSYSHPRIGSPDQDWCLNVAPVTSSTTMQVCRNDAADLPCLGALLYTGDTVESLGQVRFDRCLSQPVPVQHCLFRNHVRDRHRYVYIRHVLAHEEDEACDGWETFPTEGNEWHWRGDWTQLYRFSLLDAILSLHKRSRQVIIFHVPPLQVRRLQPRLFSRPSLFHHHIPVSQIPKSLDLLQRDQECCWPLFTVYTPCCGNVEDGLVTWL